RASGRQIRPRDTLIVGVVAVVFTSVGYSSGDLMPDIFAGIGVAAAANLLYLWKWQPRPERAFWIGLLGYATLVHSTNLALTVVLVVASFAHSQWSKVRIGLPQLLSVTACVVMGVLVQALFSRTVESATGAAPVRAPFVAMRLIADGPGYAYLNEHCSTEPYLYCRVLRQHHPY